MKVFLLEPDGELADSMDVYLNSLRLKMKIKKVKNEEALFAEDVYQDEAVSEERIRSLVRQLRAKLLPFHFVETVKGEGYRIANVKVEEPTQTPVNTIMKFCLPWLSMADCCLLLL